jgi:hypothetical protein
VVRGTILVLLPVVAILRAAAIGGLSTPAITWVGADGVAIGRARGRDRGLAIEVVAFTAVHRMNLDKSPVPDQRIGNVAARLRAVDRGGKTLLDVSGRAPYRGAALPDSVAAWERVEEALRQAPTDSGWHFIRATSDAWIAWQTRRDQSSAARIAPAAR